MKCLLVAVLLLSLVSPASSGVVEQVDFADTKTEQRYRKLIAELRCLVCQNQNLADSDSDLAEDLRRKTAEMLKDGASDKEIYQYMQERYGDFVLYRPPFNSTTALLWLGPFALLLAISIGVFLHVKRRQQDELLQPTRASDDAERVKVRNLLRDTPKLEPSSAEQRAQVNQTSSTDDKEH